MAENDSISILRIIGKKVKSHKISVVFSKVTTEASLKPTQTFIDKELSDGIAKR
jgi:hypothetical protein